MNKQIGCGMSFEVSSDTPEYEKFGEILDSPPDEQGPMIARIVEPLSIAPPLKEWATVQCGAESVQVPFVRDEVTAIRQGQEAFNELIKIDAGGSGAVRECGIGVNPHFPRRDGALNDRPRAVWGIVTAAIAAHDGMTAYVDTAWEPQGEAKTTLETMRALPGNLIAHPKDPKIENQPY